MPTSAKVHGESSDRLERSDDSMPTNVKDYYDTHLGHFYSWMAGDFKTRVQEFHKFITDNNLSPVTNPLAYDLGAGHGIQSVALAKAGFHIKAVDFNDQLLSELSINAKGLEIQVVKADIREAAAILMDKAGLILCWGDTVTHLNSIGEVRTLVQEFAERLDRGGRLVLSFRDYTTAIEGTSRFIPVKSDKGRILTCVLEYEDYHVVVTDLLHELVDNKWIQRVMSYKKIRLDPKVIVEILSDAGLYTIVNQTKNGMVTLIALKQ